MAGWFGCLLKLIGDRTGLGLVTLARGGQGRGEEKVRESVRKMEGTRIEQVRERGWKEKEEEREGGGERKEYRSEAIRRV